MPTADRIVKAQEKGMVTIPVDFREQLGIEKNSLLKAKLTKEGVLFVKLEFAGETKKHDLYSDEEVKEWMKEDKLDPKTFKKLEKLLGKKK